MTILSLCFIISVPLVCKSQAPGIAWQKSFGGSEDDGALSIVQTADSGFISAGFSESTDGDVTVNHGMTDAWIIKTDSNGNLQWQKSYGGSFDDVLVYISVTSDGGYIAAGYTFSFDGDVSGNHGENDFWVIKLDSAGNLQWQKCYGGTSYDQALFLRQTFDGGYVVTGYAASINGNVTNNHGYEDSWVVKLDNSGNLQWQKCLGGSAYDLGVACYQTADSGYIVSGLSESDDGDVSGNHGGDDAWIIKLDASGSIEWQKCLGGTSEDELKIFPTSDGGYFGTGQTDSDDGDVSGIHGGIDAWIVKLDSAGNLLWQKCLGGSGSEESSDYANSGYENADGSYIVSAISSSTDGDVAGNHGGEDYWITSVDESGNFLWQKCLGGSNDEETFSVMPAISGGYIVCGYSDSNDGDVTGNHGNYDAWVVRLEFGIPSGVVQENNTTNEVTVLISPNPFSDKSSIQFSLSQRSQVTIELHDIGGRKLQIISNEMFSEGDHQISFSDEKLLPGIYFLQLKTDHQVVSKKLIVISKGIEG